MRFFSGMLALLLVPFALVTTAQAQIQVKDGFGQCMHVPEESRANGVQLRTWTCLDKPHLKWQKTSPFTERIFGRTYEWFSLKNSLTGKCAAVHKGQVKSGSWVVQWDCLDSANFHWTLAGEILVHRESLHCLHSASGSNYAALTITTCPTGEIPQGKLWVRDSGVYWRSGLNGRCLHVPNVSRENGTQLTLWDCRGLNQMHWDPEQPRSQKESCPQGGTYLAGCRYRNRMSNKCMAVHPGLWSEGTPVVQWDCLNETNLNWYAISYTQGIRPISAVQLRHWPSGQCLTVASGALNAPAFLSPCAVPASRPPNFKWYLRGL